MVARTNPRSSTSRPLPRPSRAVLPVACCAGAVAAALALLQPASRLAGSPDQSTRTPPRATAAASPAAPTATPPAAPTAGLRPSPCWVTYTESASPRAVLLGDTVSVTLVTGHMCAGERKPLHLVFVLDGSESMSGEPQRRMRAAALETIRSLDLENFPSQHVGVVTFHAGMGRRLCRLGSTEEQLRTCIHRVGADGSAAAAPAMREAARVLAQAASDRGTEANDAILVFSAGALDDCQEAAAAARTVKGRGAEIAAVCVGDDCAASCLRDLASSPARYLPDRPLQPLLRFLEDARDYLVNVRAAQLVVRDELGPDVAYMPDSASPSQTAPDLPATWLEWTRRGEIERVFTVTYRVRPMRFGRVPLHTVTTGRLTDTEGRTRAWTFPQSWVTVLDAPSAPPTATASATATATSPPSVTPTPTATIAPAKGLYLPAAGRG